MRELERVGRPQKANSPWYAQSGGYNFRRFIISNFTSQDSNEKVALPKAAERQSQGIFSLECDKTVAFASGRSTSYAELYLF